MEQKTLFPHKEFELINKAVYFPKIKVLAIGDLHLGHEFTFRESGSLMPETQMKMTRRDIDFIFKKLKREKKVVEKVVFLGDIKHFFSYEKGEKNRFLEIMLIVGNYVPRKDVIVIKGNHEKLMKIADKSLVDFHIEGDVAFVHGDELFDNVLDKGVKMIVMGHLHPAISLEDPQKIKQERYKCYLIGRWKRKEIIVVPSFLPYIEGVAVNYHLSDGHCVVPARALKNFRVVAVGEEGDVFDFGVLKGLMGD